MFIPESRVGTRPTRYSYEILKRETHKTFDSKMKQKIFELFKFCAKSIKNNSF